MFLSTTNLISSGIRVAPLRYNQRLVYRCLSTSTLSKEESEAARAWVDKFRHRSLSRSDVELSFARSSGPGGQNVNKVNTKAVVKCPINATWIPEWTRENLKTTPAYVASSSSLQVTSTATRSQHLNVEDCLKKLHDVVLRSAASMIVNEPSEAQTKHVASLMKAEKSRLKSEKTKRSEVKSGRGKVSLGD